eukprot:366064-Chlamydomonas_euryale.AAC.12
MAQRQRRIVWDSAAVDAFVVWDGAAAEACVVSHGAAAEACVVSHGAAAEACVVLHGAAAEACGRLLRRTHRRPASLFHYAAPSPRSPTLATSRVDTAVSERALHAERVDVDQSWPSAGKQHMWGIKQGWPAAGKQHGVSAPAPRWLPPAAAKTLQRRGR